MSQGHHRIRWRWTWKDFISVAVLPLLIAAVLIVPAYVQRQVSRAQLELSCLSADSNIHQLMALRSIAFELGIPIRFEIPEVPSECREVLERLQFRS